MNSNNFLLGISPKHNSSLVGHIKNVQNDIKESKSNFNISVGMKNIVDKLIKIGKDENMSYRALYI